MGEKLKCFYCGKRAPDEEQDIIKHYEPCSMCQQTRIKDNYILLKVSKSPTKKYPDAITRVGETFYYPLGDFMVVKKEIAQRLPQFKEDNKMMCLTEEAYDIAFKSSKWYTKVWNIIQKLYRKKILQIILIVWILGCTLITNLSSEYGNYKSFSGFYNPIGTIITMTKTPKSDTGYIYAAGKVIVLYQWRCSDCEKAYPLLKQDFPDATFISAQNYDGVRLRESNLSDPVEYVPTILIADFNEYYHVYVPYYNVEEDNDRFEYDTLEVEKAKKKCNEIRQEFNTAVELTGIGEKYDYLYE